MAVHVSADTFVVKQSLVLHINICCKIANDLQGLRYFFYAYITDPDLRNIIDQKDYIELNPNPSFNVEDFNRVDDEMKSKLPYYIKTYVPLNKFLSA
ncbi:MAG: hypothetical protein ABI199_04470 [Bacteroidia bacterium]